GFNLLVHSFRALSTLRRSGLRTASAAAKPCQGDSSEVYLITGRIPTVAAAGQRHKGVSMPVRSSNVVSQLEIHDAGVSTEDANQKFLRSKGNQLVSRRRGREHLGIKQRTNRGDLEENRRNLKQLKHIKVTSCSKECEESYAKLKKLYDEQREQLGDASIEIQAYTQALKKVEAQLVCHQQNQLVYEEKIRSSDVEDSPVYDRFAKVEGMHAVFPLR
ncbi:hypothetical protein Tco_1370883, partial [Tanacetum coccineum]